MPSYLFSTAKQKGRKENRKEKGKRAYCVSAQLVPQPAQAHLPPLSSSSSSSLSSRGRGRRNLDAQGLPGRPVPFLCVLENRLAVVIPFPLSSAIFSPSLARFRRGQRDRRSTPPWQTRPTCPRARTSVSPRVPHRRLR